MDLITSAKEGSLCQSVLCGYKDWYFTALPVTVNKGFRCSSTMGTNSVIICEYHFTDFQTDPWGGTNRISPSSQLRSHRGTSGQLAMPAATAGFGNSQTHRLGTFPCQIISSAQTKPNVMEYRRKWQKKL